jgi:hypothetical protein
MHNMKIKQKLVQICLLIPALSNAQSYSVDWYKVAGGGGSSSNGQYSLSGTIGQQDAGGAMTGGSYSVTGGFWSLIAVVQSPGAPTLTITQSGNSVIVSWPSSANGFTLQHNSNLATTNWTAGGYAISTNGSVESITVSSPKGNLFFRLANP